MPAVIAGGGSVFATPAARRVARAARGARAAAPQHPGARRRADLLLRAHRRRARRAGRRPHRRGRRPAAAVGRGVRAGAASRPCSRRPPRPGSPARVLAEVGGERRLTDLRHIGEALHEVALTERLGLVALLTWLRDQVAEGRAGRGTERTRRLDSDAAAVQLVTIHASKGLRVPRRLRARRSPTATSRSRRCRSSTTTRAGAASTSAGRRRRLDRPRRALAGRGGRRVAAAALRRAHPRPVAGRRLVGADPQHPGLAAAADAGRPPARAGRGAGRVRRSGSDDEVARVPRALAGRRRAGARARRARPTPATSRPGRAAPRARRPPASPGRSTPPGGARRTPR